MQRSPVLLGAFLLIAAPFAPREIPAVFDRLALQSELENLAGSIQGLSVRQIQADPSRRALVIEGLVLRRPDLALRIGRLTLRLSAPRRFFADQAFMQAAAADVGSKEPVRDAATDLAQNGTISADDITIETGEIRTKIKHIQLDGTSLSKADLDALLDAHAPTPAAERLAKISATHVAIPEMVIETKPAVPDAQADGQGKAATPQDETIVLRDIAMDNVVQGRAGLVTIAATSAIMHSPETEEMQAAFGLIRFTGLDLVQLARLMSPAGGNGTGPQHQLCDSLGVDGGKIFAPKAQAELGVEALTIKDIKTAATTDSLRHGAKQGHVPGTDNPLAGRVSPIAHLLQGIDIGSLEFTNLHFATTSGTPWSATISRGFLAQMVAAQITEAGFENASIAGHDATVKIGRFGWHGLNLGAPLELLGTPAPTAESPGGTPPGQQKITADTVDINVTSAAANPSLANMPTRFQLGHVEITSSTPVDGVPTRVAAAFDHFICDLKNVNDNVPAVAALGYSKLDLSSRLAVHLDNDNTEFGLDALSLSGVDMGSIQISGFLDHLTKALFSSDPDESKTALLNVLLRHFELRVENTGLFERLIAAEAKQTNTSPAEIRKKLIDSVTSVVPQLLADGRDADLVTAALTKFIMEPKTFRLSIIAPQGIGAFDAALLKDPEILLQKIEIEVAADE